MRRRIEPTPEARGATKSPTPPRARRRSLGNRFVSKMSSARVLVERHAGGGAEFTVVVVETASGPVALAPTEVEVFPEFTEGAEFTEDERHRVFDFRAKYLPSSRVAYHSPARFGEEGVAFVRRRAEEAFQVLGLRDCARLDGFYMPRDHPAVSWTKKNERGANANDSSKEAVFEPVFADVNVASGMEQTSFLFLQAAQAGMSHGARSGACWRAPADARACPRAFDPRSPHVRARRAF